MTMTAPEPPRPASTTWEVIPLGRGAWRICDSTRERTDASRLVAYVDSSEIGTLDVLWLRSPCPTRSRYRDLAELLADLDAAAEAAAEAAQTSRATRPIQIPHFPPSR